MDFSSINWLAVLSCVVVSMISGSLWFGPKTFFPIWWKAIGKTEKDTPGGNNMGLMWGGTVAASVVQAVSMAFMVNVMGSGMSGGVTMASGAMTGFMLWFGFVAATGITNKLFAGQLKAWFLETGNHLINFVLFGAILGAWR
ncbi:MAG: DUF1761 domain-containing protein [Chloroflexi bacterium]|nr:DUF1761 domain-containing protein [Chloroflexota bacterium]